MNSIDIIKQQLIRQRELLEQSGIVVNVSNRNPTPTEITNAIENMNIDFTATTATEEDVKAGKTFYSQNNEIKTGTCDFSEMDIITHRFNVMVSGCGEIDIELPSNVDRIRPYAFYTMDNSENIFNKHNFTIPNHILTVGDYAFFKTNLTGVLTIPETCTQVGRQAFSYTFITEANVYNGFNDSTGPYALSYCSNLTTVRFYPPLNYLPIYLFSNCKYLNTIEIHTNLTNFCYSTIYECKKLRIIKFCIDTPITIASNTFSTHVSTNLLVPYQHYDEYFNFSNYQAYGNPMFGFGEFEQGAELPATAEGYTITWHPTLDDAKANTNPVTTASETATYYSRFTSTETE
ncbi:MAG: leucine-rich repeat domain-containing protein [Clostridia bacterium]